MLVLLLSINKLHVHTILIFYSQLSIYESMVLKIIRCEMNFVRNRV